MLVKTSSTSRATWLSGCTLPTRRLLPGRALRSMVGLSAPANAPLGGMERLLDPYRQSFEAAARRGALVLRAVLPDEGL